MNKRVFTRSVEIAHALCPLNRTKQNIRSSHIAFLVKKNKIIKIGLNKKRTHPKTQNFPYIDKENKPDKTIIGIHAELDVIIKSGKEDLSDHEIIVLRVDNEGKLNNSKPCVGCMSAINQFGLKNIYYSNSKGEIEKV